MRRRTRAIGAVVEAVRGGLPLRRSGEGLTIVAYHRIDDHGGGLAVSRDEFLAQLDWISEAGLPVVDVTRPPSDGEGMRIALTFDDGYRSVAETAWPALCERNWPATMYAVSRTLHDTAPFEWDGSADRSTAALIDGRLLRELADDGMTIGSHTKSHRYLRGLRSTEVDRELRDSRRELEDALGRSVTSFSYPMGGWNRDIRSLVERSGYLTAVTMDRGTNLAGQDRLALRRHPADPDLETFVEAIAGRYDFLRPIDRWRSHRAALAVGRH